MNKLLSPKIVTLAFGILVISFLIVFYVFAWQEPAETPPEGNVPTPINVSDVAQIKEGDLTIGIAEIQGDGSMSPELNADKLDDYHAADLLAGWGYTECQGICTQSETISCPTGWTRVAWSEGIGCEEINWGIRPQWGGQWQVYTRSIYNYVGSWTYQKTLCHNCHTYDGMVRNSPKSTYICGINCRATRNDPKSDNEWPASVAVCCQ